MNPKTLTCVLLFSMVVERIAGQDRIPPLAETGWAEAWSRHYGDFNNESPNAMAQTSDRGFVMVGSTNSPWGKLETTNQYYLYVVKTDADGRLDWQWADIGIPEETATGVVELEGGDFLVAGHGAEVTLDERGQLYTDSRDVLLVRLTAKGLPIWKIALHREGEQYAYSLLELPGAGFRLIGSSFMEIDAAGKLLSNHPHIRGEPLVRGDDGNLATASNEGPWPTIRLQKFDPLGRLLGELQLEGLRHAGVHSLQTAADGGYLVATVEQKSNVDFDSRLIRVDVSGARVWERTIGGPGSDRISAVRRTESGDYLVVGSTSSHLESGTIVLMRLTDRGEVLWQGLIRAAFLGGAPDDVVETPDGGYVIAGRVQLEQRGNLDFLILKVSPSFLRGDVDGGGRVGVSDAVRVLGHLFADGGTALVRCRDAGDANDDGRIDLSDAIDLLSFLFLHGPALPAPWPKAGADPTSDDLNCGQ